MECPIQYVSDLSANIAEKIYGDTASGFVQYFAKALDDYGVDKDLEKIIPPIDKVNIQQRSSLNFRLRLQRIIEYVYDTEEGEEFKRQYNIRVDVYQQNGRMVSFDAKVESHKVKDINWLKSATDSLATLPKGKEQTEEFCGMVQQCIETSDVPREIIYPNPGWRDVPDIGWRYVFGEGVVNGHNGLIHTSPKHHKLMINGNRLGLKETFKKANGMMGICKNRVASTELFLFTHATMLSTLFEKAGHRINFLFGICGVTNSRKTSMTLAIAKVFGRDDPSRFKADAQFAVATRCGIETMLSVYKDAPIIIDDFKPGANPQEQRELDRKLDELARFYGDGIAKKRMTDFLRDKDKKYFPIYSGCVLTMEIVTGVQSSVSRMFITEIDVKEVDNDVLRYYQENPWILSTHIYDFLAWATDRFHDIIWCISKKFGEFRQENKFEVARYAEMYALLKVTALLISQYAVERRFWDESESECFLAQVGDMVVKELYSMGDRLKKHDKSSILLKTLDEAINSANTVFTWLTTESCAKGESCYEDNNFYYMQTKKLLQISKEYCSKYLEREQIVTDSEIISLLEKLGLLDIRETNSGHERSRKLPISKGNAKRYLYIKKDRLEELLSQLE